MHVRSLLRGNREIPDIREKLMKRMHRPVDEIGKWLRSVAQGHFNFITVKSVKKCVILTRSGYGFDEMEDLRKT